MLIEIARGVEKNGVIQREKHSDIGLSFYHILEYIDAHSAEPLEVRQLAEMCHMSYSNFARLFRENYGRSCKEYIKYIRLNKAQDLLLNSDYNLDYIAQETGFFDCSHFIRTYKKWRGITPKQERMRKQGGCVIERNYEKLGGFSCVLGELRTRLGERRFIFR